MMSVKKSFAISFGFSLHKRVYNKYNFNFFLIRIIKFKFTLYEPHLREPILVHINWVHKLHGFFYGSRYSIVHILSKRQNFLPKNVLRFLYFVIKVTTKLKFSVI